MVYGVILASGVGSRMKSETPKQFMKLNNVPIVAYTIYSMIKVDRIDKIIVVSHPDYIDTMKGIISEYFSGAERERLAVIGGGVERIDSIDNAASEIVSYGQVGEDDVVIFHDAVRPFVTERVLNDSIDGALKYNATVTALSAVDTMLYSEDGLEVNSIPDRSKLYRGQAPDTFRLKHFIDLRSRISPEKKNEIFGTSRICEMNGEPIYMVEGDELNFKITNPEDIQKAELYLMQLQERDHESFKFAGSR